MTHLCDDCKHSQIKAGWQECSYELNEIFLQLYQKHGVELAIHQCNYFQPNKQVMKKINNILKALEDI